MADNSNAPFSPSIYRIPALKDYLPLSYEQPSRSGSMIQSRSTTNLAVLRKNSFLGTKRRSSFDADDLPPRNRERDVEDGMPDLQLSSPVSHWGGGDEWEGLRKQSIPASLVTPQMRSQRLIGENPNPRYRWEQYWKTEEQLKKMKKPIRKYYERNNYLIQHYMYIDRLLDSSLPHNLIQEYHTQDQSGKHPAYGSLHPNVPDTITEETSPMDSPRLEGGTKTPEANGSTQKVKRTPKDMYRIQDSENTPLLSKSSDDEEEQVLPPDLEVEDEADSQSRIVTIAIYVNLVANTVRLSSFILTLPIPKLFWIPEHGTGDHESCEAYVLVD